MRVTGTVERVPIAQIERRGGFLTDPKIRAEIQEKPALVVSEMSTIEPAAVAINLLVRPEAPVGTAGRPEETPVTDASEIGRVKDRPRGPAGEPGTRDDREPERDGILDPDDRRRAHLRDADEPDALQGRTDGVHPGRRARTAAGPAREDENASDEEIDTYADRVTTR